MDCPNCGVYNPEERQICWRCDQELPKPKEPTKRRRDPAQAARRMWIMIAIVVVIWILLRKRENSFNSWDQLGWWALAGFSSALLQIGLIDLARYLLTGTWSGFLDY